MIFLNVLAMMLSSQLLIRAAEEIGPAGSVDVFYSMELPSLETFELASGVLEDYQGIYRVDYHLMTDPWPRHLLGMYGMPVEQLCFAVAVNGSCRAVIDGDTVEFRDLPVRMHGAGATEGEWTLGHLEAVLRDNSLLLDGTGPADPYSFRLAESILEDAVSYLGAPYLWGGTDGRGFDCSGLTWRVFNDNGIPLPRTVGAIEEMGVPVDMDDLQPGDIIIFDSPRHTGIYMGDGKFIHASSWQDRGVVITPLSTPNYSRRYSSAVRVLGTGAGY